MDLDLYLVPCTKINLKWITELNANAKTIKPLGEKKIKEFYGLGFGKNS